jgi:peptide/nickel transport system substrate-binding protein
VFSDNDRTVTVKLNPYKWSDGEAVTARDAAFWINLYKAAPAKNFCGYVPGYFPDNVTGVDTPDAQTVVLHLNKSYDPTWATSPLWAVVDGPFKLQSFTSTGQVTLVPNPDYSGSPKATIAKLVELPFTSDTAVFNEIRAAGPSSLTIANLPSQGAPQIPTVKSQGYDYNAAASYSVNRWCGDRPRSAPTRATPGPWSPRTSVAMRPTRSGT